MGRIASQEAVEDCVCLCSKHERHWVPDGILVLCPNAALSSQVDFRTQSALLEMSHIHSCILCLASRG